MKNLFQVAENECVKPGYYRIRLTGTGLETAKPGQFVMVRQIGQTEPLLRRPFSIHRFHTGERNGFEILYQVKGVFTEMLSACKPYDLLSVLGPLGNGFSLKDIPLYIVAGGIGVAPMVFWVEDLIRKGFDLRNVEFFLGARSEEDLLMNDFLKKLGIKLHLCTDDGSMGQKGFVTDAFQKRAHEAPPMAVVTCGPEGMLQAVAGFCTDWQIPCEISMEAYMACGIGACLGCAVKSAAHPEKFSHVCQDGPVFNAKDMIW